jgi:hypothetical protein
MAIATNLNQRIEGQKLLFTAATDTMIIGGIVSNLSVTDAYFSLKPFMVNAKIDRGFPFQLQTKLLAPALTEVKAFATDTPVNLFWDSSDGWNSEVLEDWNGSIPNFIPVLLNITIAEI